jgi:hypothetical protein
LNRLVFIAVALALVLGSFLLGRSQGLATSALSTEGGGLNPSLPEAVPTMPVDPSLGSGESSEAARGNVVVTPSRIDLGVQPFGIQPSASLRLTNTGQESVSLVAVSPTCGCLATDFSGRVAIAPGESHTIQVIHEERNQAGPSQASLRCMFLGNVMVSVPVEVVFARPVKADPTWVDFARDGDRGVLTLRSIDTTPFRVLSLQGRPVVPDAGEDPDTPALVHRIKWDLREYDTESCVNPQGERMPPWLVVETDHPDASLVDVRVRQDNCTAPDIPNASDNRPWLVLDQRVVLEPMAPGESTVVELRVGVLPGRTMVGAFTKARSESEGLAANFLDVIAKSDNDVIRVELGPSADCPAGVMMGTFQIESSAAGHDQQIHVFGVVRPAK